MFVAFPIPSSMFQRCAILLVLAQQKETKLLHASHSKWHETFQLPWVSNGVTKANTEKKQFPFNRPQYKGRHSSRFQQMILLREPHPTRPSNFPFVPSQSCPSHVSTLLLLALPRHLPPFTMIAVIVPLQPTAHTPHPVYCTSSDSSRSSLPPPSIPQLQP